MFTIKKKMQYITDALGKMLLKFFFKASPLLVIENHLTLSKWLVQLAQRHINVLSDVFLYAILINHLL